MAWCALGLRHPLDRHGSMLYCMPVTAKEEERLYIEFVDRHDS